jgi:hypothetical protein
MHPEIASLLAQQHQRDLRTRAARARVAAAARRWRRTQRSRALRSRLLR